VKKLKGFPGGTVKVPQPETELKEMVEEGMKRIIGRTDKSLQIDDGKSGNLLKLFV